MSDRELVDIFSNIDVSFWKMIILKKTDLLIESQ